MNKIYCLLKKTNNWNMFLKLQYFFYVQSLKAKPDLSGWNRIRNKIIFTEFRNIKYTFSFLTFFIALRSFLRKNLILFCSLWPSLRKYCRRNNKRIKFLFMNLHLNITISIQFPKYVIYYNWFNCFLT